MYLDKKKVGNKTYWYLVEKYRTKEGTWKKRTIESLGHSDVALRKIKSRPRMYKYYNRIAEFAEQEARSVKLGFKSGDAFLELKQIPSGFFRSCITSPPYYGLRNYGSIDDQVGTIEETLDEYLDRLTAIFKEVKRTLVEDGTLFIIIGDSYVTPERKKQTGLPEKCLMGVPWRLALRLVDAGFILRSDIIWEKGNHGAPESVTDRVTRNHEYVFMFSKSPKYHFNPIKVEAITDAYKDKGRNLRSLWSFKTGYSKEHPAVCSQHLVQRCIELSSSPNVGDVILDPFAGSGTISIAEQMGRGFLGIDINPSYIKLAEKRRRNPKN